MRARVACHTPEIAMAIPTVCEVMNRLWRSKLYWVLAASALLAALSPAESIGGARTVAATAPRLAVLDMQLSGDLGGPELDSVHAARLRMASGRLREELASTGLYQVLDNAPAAALIEHLKSQQRYWHDCNGCDLDVGRQLGADQVLVAWVNRVSALILTLTYEIHGVRSGQILARKSFDFRGDNDLAWTHAIRYMVRDLQEHPTAHQNGS